MNDMTFSPALGWPAGIVIALVMAVAGIWCVINHVRNHATSDETLVACIRRTVVCLLVAVLALTPSTVMAVTSRAINATDVVVALDVTGSMGVQDATYGSDETISRIDAARHAVRDITSMYANADFAALSFASSATLDVPLTPDQQAVNNWASSLNLEPTDVSSGSNLDAPIDQLLLTLRSIRDQHPDDAIILYLITDGEQTSSKNRRSYSTLRAYLNDAFTVGVGSSEGGQIPYISNGEDAGNSETPWVIDPDTNEPGVSKLDEQNLKDIADELGGTYLALDDTQTMLGGLSEERSEQWRVTQTSKERTRMSPVIWPLALAITALLIWEGVSWLATNRRLL